MTLRSRYETARVLTGLANFLIDYPKAQSEGANVTAQTFTDTLRTYAQTHTKSSAANGTRQPPTDALGNPIRAPPASLNQPCGEFSRRSATEIHCSTIDPL
jgi:hypothetical protein